MSFRWLVPLLHPSGRVRYLRLFSLMAYLLGSAPTAARATVVTTTLTGTMYSGTDIYGVLGFPQGTNLVGKAFTLVYTFDDTKGTQDIIEIPSGTCDQSITSSSLSNPGTAVLTIAGGIPYSIASTGTITRSNQQMGGGGCQTKPTNYINLAQGIDGSTAEDISTTVMTPMDSQFFGDTSWEYNFTATPKSGSGNFRTVSSARVQTSMGQFTITNVTVSSDSSAPSSSGLQFVPLTPCRVADTRGAAGPFGSPSLAANSTREFDIPQSACATPNAVAYSLNVTAVPKGNLGYLTVWPSGQAQPTVSTLNSDGRVKANAAIVPAGSNGGVSIYVTDPADVVLDIDGYFVAPGNSSGLEFYALTPCRIADTRGGSGLLGGPSFDPQSSRVFPVMASGCNIPADAKAYSLNLTAIPKGPLNYLTIWPTGSAQPVVSTLNAPTGTVTANAAIVSAGTNGSVSVFAYNATDLVMDVNGYFAAPSANGLSLYPTTPCRVLDTRNTSGALNGALGVAVENSTCAPPASARAYVLNATVVPAASLGYLTLWPAGETQPTVSTLNAEDGAITSNMAIAPTINGSLNAFSSASTQLILDISSYFAP